MVNVNLINFPLIFIYLNSQSNDNFREGLYVDHYKSDLEKFKKIHSEKNPKVSLYNLKNDPQEMENVAEKYPDKASRFLSLNSIIEW